MCYGCLRRNDSGAGLLGCIVQVCSGPDSDCMIRVCFGPGPEHCIAPVCSASGSRDCTAQLYDHTS